jgi:peptidyl-prolyl cis-trans isomerase C
MLNNLAKSRLLIALPVAAAALMVAGCDAKQETPAATTPAKNVDLATTVDLFSDPVKPDPLANDPEAVVLTVNGKEITQGQIMEQMDKAMKMYGSRIPPQQMATARQQIQNSIVDQMVTKILLEGAIAESGVTVSDEEMTEAVETITGSLPPESNLEEELAKNDTSMEEFQEEIKHQLQLKKLMEEVTKDIADTTDEEAKAFYESNMDQFKKPETASARHILISFEEGDSDEIKAEKKAQLEKIRADIIAGTTTFEEAATEHSGCPSGKQNQGSLGSFEKGRMVPAFEMAAFTQELNEVGDIVETDFGYHIIEVTDRQEASTVELDEVLEDLKDFLTNQKKQEAVQAFMKDLRDSAAITTADANE